MAILHYTENGRGREYKLTDSQNLFGGATAVPGVVTIREAQTAVQDPDLKDLGIKREVRTAYGSELTSLVTGKDRGLAQAAIQFMEIFDIPVEKYRVHDTVRQELLGIFSGWENPQKSLNHRVVKKLENLGLGHQIVKGAKGIPYLQVVYQGETVDIHNNPGTFRGEVNRVVSMMERVENRKIGLAS